MSSEIDGELTAVLCKSLNIVVVCLYRSPSGSFDLFCSIMTELLDVLTDYKQVVIAGDFNVKFGTGGGDAVKVADILSSFGFKQTINSATRGRNCLDNIFVNFSHDCYTTSIYDTNLSDHMAQSINVTCTKKCITYNTRVMRPITGVGCSNFFKLFRECDLNFLDDLMLSANDKYTEFHNRFVLCFNTCFPERQVTRRIDHGINWYNDKLKLERLHCQFVTDLYNRYRSDNLLQLKRQARSQYRKSISVAKIEATSKFIGDSNNKAKSMWSVINSKRGSSVKKAPPLDPDELNSYFVRISERIVSALPASATSPLSLCVTFNTDAELYFTGVSEVEARDILKGLKASGTRDAFGVSTNFIKKHISLFVSPLVKLINSSFENGEFPDLLKEAYVVPIHKGGDADEISNYRPISILPAFSKVFERAIYNRIVRHVEGMNCLFANQFGFRRGRNTADAVNEFTNQCLSAFENGEYCVTIFLDLSRAFDCVSHLILLQKLQCVYNFKEQSLELIRSYLKSRTQRVVIGDGMSANLAINRGVPQGSILGPLLFLFFLMTFHLLWRMTKM